VGGAADTPFILACWMGCTDALLALEYQVACLDAEDEDDAGGSVIFHAAALPDGSLPRRSGSLIVLSFTNDGKEAFQSIFLHARKGRYGGSC
jgi:hypothetical protein